MPREFAVISVPSLVVNVADGQIEAVFPSAELAQHYLEAEKRTHPDRRYGIREKPGRNHDGETRFRDYDSEAKPGALHKGPCTTV